MFVYLFSVFGCHSTQLGWIVFIWSISRCSLPLETLERPLVADLAFRPFIGVGSEAGYAAVAHFFGKQKSALCTVVYSEEATVAYLRTVSVAIRK